MSGPIWKGTQGPLVENVEAQFDAETRTYNKRTTYNGSRTAIAGIELDFQSTGISYDVRNNGPVYTLSTRVPSNDAAVDELDRYEIGTETGEIEIWQVPSVVTAADEWDVAHPLTPTWRKLAEQIATDPSQVDVAYPLTDTFNDVVKNLKAGVNHFPVDFLVLRRFRKISQDYSTGAAGKFLLTDGTRIYTTSQLNLPSNVAFVLPSAPATNPAFDDLFQWGWRRRSQQVQIVGAWVEQHVELLFAPHSLLYYSVGTGNLNW
jgi:hypothetical protein